MKHSGYTPGPWRVSTADGKYLYIQAKHATIAQVDSRFLGDHALRHADAALIADAPRLAEENERLRAALNLAATRLEAIENETTKVMRMQGWKELNAGSEWFGPSCHAIQDIAAHGAVEARLILKP